MNKHLMQERVCTVQVLLELLEKELSVDPDLLYFAKECHRKVKARGKELGLDIPTTNSGGTDKDMS